MSEIAAPSLPSPAGGGGKKGASGLTALLRHTRYVLGENPVPSAFMS